MYIRALPPISSDIISFFRMQFFNMTLPPETYMFPSAVIFVKVTMPPVFLFLMTMSPDAFIFFTSALVSSILTLLYVFPFPSKNSSSITKFLSESPFSIGVPPMYLGLSAPFSVITYSG